MSSFRQFKRDQKRWYQSIGSVYCPALKEEVFFTSEGFQHLLFKRSRQRRTKYQLLVRDLEFAGWGGVKKKCVYFQLVGVVQSTLLVRVVLQKTGFGKLTFLSIMPHRLKTKKHLEKVLPNWY